MKRIGIDARLYFQTGVGVYLRNLLYYLQQQDTTGYQFYIYVMEQDASKIEFTNKNFIKRTVVYKWHTFIEQIGFLSMLYRDKLDLMHFTYFSHPVLYNKPFISTIHDVIILDHKTGRASTKSSLWYKLKHAAFTFALSHQVKKSISIITPTYTVKDQLIKAFGNTYANKIAVLYEGIDYNKLNTEPSDKKTIPLKDYFLYVGNFYPHKNVERLLYAFAKIKKYHLVLVGPSDYFSKRMQAITQKIGITDKVHFYFHIPDPELLNLYKNAQALIHPSLSEGLGLPLVEAAYLNIPIIASDIPVYKEILGDSYMAFDPTNSNNIAQTIQEFINKKPKFNYKDKLSIFSFPLMAENTLKLYKTALN